MSVFSPTHDAAIGFRGFVSQREHDMFFQLTEEQQSLKDAARNLAQKDFKDKAARWDQNCEYPAENHRKLAQLGYLGLSVDEAYGGSGLGLVDVYLVVEEIAKVDMTTALLVHDQNVSPRIIATYGDESQKQRFMPGFVAGELHCTICWTEPEAGSDATAITTSAVLDGDAYVVNGRKVFTTYGDRADYHLLYARFGQSKGARGIGILVVKNHSPGITVQTLPGKMGTRGANECEIFFDDVRVPVEDVIIAGDVESSAGFVKPLQIYNGTRVGMGVLALGVAEGAFDLARDYMKTRRQFGKTLAEMQGLQWMMADMAIEIEAARLLCYQALSCFDAGKPDPYLSSIAKVQATEMAQRVTHQCQQMFGGYGYFGLMPLERMVRDVRMLTITGGTTQMQKNNIARAIFQD
jgi:alkylation response protein AidB-like acyl-CoA dehydrogenase